MNCVPQLFGRIIKHVTACCHVWCMNKHMYHTDIHTHIIATALQGRNQLQRRRTTISESWPPGHLEHISHSGGGRERLSSFIMCYQALAMISVTVLLLYTNLWDIHVYLFALITSRLTISIPRRWTWTSLLAYRLSNISFVLLDHVVLHCKWCSSLYCGCCAFTRLPESHRRFYHVLA